MDAGTQQMTDRLYYNDPALVSFEANITGSGTRDGRPWVTLDRSAFYPTSGGQLHDLGTLNGIPVVEVLEDDSGEVVHLLEGPLGSPEEKISGEVDPERRRHFRQQHTAQHILSQAFFRLYDLQTKSVHLGLEYAAVELPADEISDDKLATAETLANDVIRAGDPIQIMFVTPEEAANLPLRKVPQVREKIRIIRVGDFDWSACGGTHCSTTAEVGMIKIVATERLRKRTLVKFLAGDLAFADYARRFDVTAILSKRLTCHIDDLPEKFEKLDEELKVVRQELTALRKEMLPSRADALASSAIKIGRYSLVGSVEGDSDAKLATQLASLVADKLGGVAAIIAESRLLLATASESDLHAGKLAKQLSERIGLRGGGGQNQAQLGGAEPAKLDEYVTQLKALLANE
jgi:alanyl-tRNA synthetase